MNSPITKYHQRTYDAIFQHPIARQLHRRDVMAMLTAVAEVNEESNGNVKATRNGQTLVWHASRDKDIVASEELMLIRHFLQRSENPASSKPQRDGDTARSDRSPRSADLQGGTAGSSTRAHCPV